MDEHGRQERTGRASGAKDCTASRDGRIGGRKESRIRLELHYLHTAYFSVYYWSSMLRSTDSRQRSVQNVRLCNPAFVLQISRSEGYSACTQPRLARLCQARRSMAMSELWVYTGKRRCPALAHSQAALPASLPFSSCQVLQLLSAVFCTALLSIFLCLLCRPLQIRTATDSGHVCLD